jgi:hypothetical protein
MERIEKILQTTNARFHYRGLDLEFNEPKNQWCVFQPCFTYKPKYFDNLKDALDFMEI